MNEMEADLRRAEIDAQAKIQVAKTEAESRENIAKIQAKTARRAKYNPTVIIVSLLVFLFFGGGVGGVIYQHVNYTNHYAEQIARCEASGGVWTPRIQRVFTDTGHNDSQQDEWYTICVKK